MEQHNVPALPGAGAKSSARRSLEALGLGVAVDVGGSLLTTELFTASMIAVFSMTGLFFPSLLPLWTVVIGLAGLFAGAFLAAWFAPSRPLLHAAVVGVIDAAVTFGVLSAGMFSPLLLLYGALLLPAALGAGTMARWVRGPDRALLESGRAPRLLQPPEE